MQPMVSSQKLVDRPLAETRLYRLGDSQVDLIPDPVVQSDHTSKNNCAGNRKYCDYCNHRQRFVSGFVHSQLNFLIFAFRNRLITKDFCIVSVMENRMHFKCSFERRVSIAEKVSSVHQISVDLMLNERHYHARYKYPANENAK